MIRRTTLSRLSRAAVVLATAGLVSGVVLGASVSFPLITQSESLKEPDQLLMAIFKEVRELGFRENEDFIKREFHIDLDGSMANREEHIVVLSHLDGNGEKMILQVTYFGETASGGIARYSKEIREISCQIEGNALVIQHCGFDVDEARHVLPEILKGIQDEKKLLKLLDHKY